MTELTLKHTLPASIESTLKKCDELIKKYSYEGHLMNCEQLLKINDRLSGYMYFLCEYATNYDLEYSCAYMNRKVAVARSYNEFRALGKELEEKITQEDAKNSAEYQCLEKFQEELNKEYLSKRIINTIKGIEKVLMAITMRISYIKSEKTKFNS